MKTNPEDKVPEILLSRGKEETEKLLSQYQTGERNFQFKRSIL